MTVGGAATPVLIVMGVSGCGKSTIGEMLAHQLGWAFQEGDALHPPANVAKMQAGNALDDADRAPWLDRLGHVIDQWQGAGRPGILTCSALRRPYRAALIAGRAGVRFLYLKGDPALIGPRLSGRRGHFMPESLLASQFATLEEPEADEPCLTIPIDRPPAALVALILARLAETAPPTPASD